MFPFNAKSKSCGMIDSDPSPVMYTRLKGLVDDTDNSTWKGGMARSGTLKSHLPPELTSWEWKYEIIASVRRSEGVWRASNGVTGADWSVWTIGGRERCVYPFIEYSGGGEDVHPLPLEVP